MSVRFARIAPPKCYPFAPIAEENWFGGQGEKWNLPKKRMALLSFRWKKIVLKPLTLLFYVLLIPGLPSRYFRHDLKQIFNFNGAL